MVFSYVPKAFTTPPEGACERRVSPGALAAHGQRPLPALSEAGRGAWKISRNETGIIRQAMFD